MGTACLTLALPSTLPAAWPVLQALEPRQWLQIGAYRHADASTLAPFAYLQILSATTVGWLVWGYFPDALTWVGIAILCASGITVAVLEGLRSRARGPQG